MCAGPIEPRVTFPGLAASEREDSRALETQVTDGNRKRPVLIAAAAARAPVNGTMRATLRNEKTRHCASIIIPMGVFDILRCRERAFTSSRVTQSEAHTHGDSAN